jgi:hypothetical protein
MTTPHIVVCPALLLNLCLARRLEGWRTVSKLKYPEWQTSYQEALFESDKRKLDAKIHLAELKIFRRLQTITADIDHQEEKTAIADALNALRSLKLNSLNYPG